MSSIACSSAPFALCHDAHAPRTPAIDEVAGVRGAWASWQSAKGALEQAMDDIAATKLQEDYLKYAVAELESLNPQPGEEAALAEKRRYLMNFEKMRDGFT